MNTIQTIAICMTLSAAYSAWLSCDYQLKCRELDLKVRESTLKDFPDYICVPDNYVKENITDGHIGPAPGFTVYVHPRTMEQRQ